MVDIANNKHVEQVAIMLLLDNAYETFDKELLSIYGRSVLWGSFKSASDLKDRYLASKDKSHLLDRRRRLSEEDRDFIEIIESAAKDAWEYVVWARDHSGQPIYREALVTCFVAFENCLKAIATAFEVSSDRNAKKCENHIYVPLNALSSVRRRVGKKWGSPQYSEWPKGRQFYENEIVKKNPFPNDFSFEKIDEAVWEKIGAAYKARNAIVHTMGLSTEQFEFGGQQLYPGDKIEVKVADLREISSCLHKVLSPFCPLRYI